MNSLASHRCLLVCVTAVALFGVLGFSVPASRVVAQPNQPPPLLSDVASAIAKMWDDDSPDSRILVARSLAELQKNKTASAAEIEAALKKGPQYAPQTPGVGTLEFKGVFNTNEVAGVYVPKAYDPSKEWPCVVFLHGGLNNERNRGTKVVADFKDVAEQYGFIVVAPSTTRNAAWWVLEGASNTLRALKTAKGRFNLDENRVFLAGFSEGGTGVMYFAGHLTTPFAGYLNFSGNPAGCGTNQAYGAYSLYNLRNRPILATYGNRDTVFQPSVLEGHFAKIKAAQAALEVKSFDGDHSLKYVFDNFAAFGKFITTTTRDPFPKTVTWEWDGTHGLNRCDWLIIEEVRKKADTEPALDDLDLEAGMRALGLRFDPNYKGEGVAVSAVSPNTSEEYAGIEPGDIIVRVNDKPVRSALDFQQLISAGEILHLWVKRQGEPKELELIAEFPPAKRILQRTTGKDMGLAIAKISGNKVSITARGVKKISIMVAPGLFDVNKPIEVTVNEMPAFAGQVALKTDFMIEEAQRNRDRKTVYLGKFTFEVPTTRAQDW